jgi:phage gpG-like protein
MIVTNLKQVRQAVEKAGKSIDKGAEACRDEMMTTLIQLSKETITGKRGKTNGVWDKATAGQPPMNRTGNLRRSIRGQKINKGFGKYEAIVGPTIIYGRAVELGGKYAPRSWKGTSAMDGFPYMKPAFQKFKLQVPMIIRKHLAVTK